MDYFINGLKAPFTSGSTISPTQVLVSYGTVLGLIILLKD